MQDAGRGGEVERPGELGDDGERVGERRRAVLAKRGVERFGRDVGLREPRGRALDAGGDGRRDRGMIEAAGGEVGQGGGELGGAFGDEIEAERLDGDEAAFESVVRAKNRAQRSGADLVQHAERSESFWNCSWDRPVACQ